MIYIKDESLSISNKRKILDIIKYEYGFTEDEAMNYLQNDDVQTIQALIRGFQDQAKTSFYCD